MRFASLLVLVFALNCILLEEIMKLEVSMDGKSIIMRSLFSISAR